jgi:cell division protein FtsB
MLVIGLLLVLIALAALGIVIYDGAEKVQVEAFGATGDTTVMGVFVTGVGITLLFFLGTWLLKSGNARSRKQRADRKAQRIRHRESVAKLEQERNELRAENERLAKAAGRPPVTSTGQGPATGPGSATGPASDAPRGAAPPPSAGAPPAAAAPPSAAAPRGTAPPPAANRPAPGGTPPAPPRQQVDLTPSGRHAGSRGTQTPPRYAGDDQVSRDHQHRI